MAGEHLQKITKKAKQIRKEHPQMKWTNAVKQASKMLSKTNTKTAKTMTKRKTVVVAGNKAHHAAPETHKKKRKVSGVSHGKMKLSTVAWMLGGSIVGGSVGAILYRKIPGTGLIKGGVQLGIGAGGMMMLGDKKPFLFGLANGIGTGGGVNLMHTAGVISGVEEMVSGLFDGLDGVGYDRQIPQQTAGNTQYIQEEIGLHDAGYVGVTSADIDKWVFEGVPAQGAEDWK
jgi:hypothetical protein